MSENKNNMVTSAMNYAIPLGLFWVFKYLFVILGDYSELSKYVNSILGIGTPILFYILLCRYRDKNLGGIIDYGNSVLFSLLLFVFASLLEVAIVSLHIFILNPAFLDQLKEQMLLVAESFSMLGQGYVDQMRLMATNMGGYYIFSLILGNMMTGLFLALILGYFVSKSKPNHPKTY